MSHSTSFDEYAESYDEALAQGLSVSGEDKEYFARGRLDWLANCLHNRQEHIRTVMDYGCGTGSATPFLFACLGAESVLGLDISQKSLEVARKTHGSAQTKFLSFDQYQPQAQIELAFCNGVFHHIPPAERAAAVQYIYHSLRPGGYFALWENNPWNPGTRYVMSQCPFDQDAITLTPPEARQLVCTAGFQYISTNFLFIFPRFLRRLRGLEPRLARLPLGAQYQILVCKPA